MATNLGIDDKLLAEALKVGGQKTKKATVNLALSEFISAGDNSKRLSCSVRSISIQIMTTSENDGGSAAATKDDCSR